MLNIVTLFYFIFVVVDFVGLKIVSLFIQTSKNNGIYKTKHKTYGKRELNTKCYNKSDSIAENQLRLRQVSSLTNWLAGWLLDNLVIDTHICLYGSQ